MHPTSRAGVEGVQGYRSLGGLCLRDPHAGTDWFRPGFPQGLRSQSFAGSVGAARGHWEGRPGAGVCMSDVCRGLWSIRSVRAGVTAP